MLSIAIAEDQQEVADQIRSYIDRYAAETGIRTACEWFPDGADLLQRYTLPSRPRYDIILLDIEMGQVNGLETARQIRTKDRKVVLAFVTNMAQYAIRGYEVDALDFILKPVEYASFRMRFDRMVARVRERTDIFLEIHTTGGLQRVRLGEIRYLETQNRLLYYHVGGGKVYTSRDSMREAAKDLTRGHFAKCNQCYLVNLAYVNGIHGDQVTVDGEVLDMSRRCKTPFLAELSDYMAGDH